MNVKKYFQQKKYLWIITFLLIVLIKIFSANSVRVEAVYSSGFYFGFSEILRFLFGWIPFSFGDVLYFLAVIFLFLLITQRNLVRR